MHPRLLTFVLLAAVPLGAQQIDDPANLMGERVSAPALADTLPINHGAPALEQLLRKLRTRASMMLIVAHPDDEDGGLLTLESRGMGARVAMLTLTRGEGGQNLMTADFNDALGLIRTQELLAEDRYTGTNQFFGTEVDFGFSKTKEESFAKWTHDRVLYDAVRCVRLYRPLVLASVFLGGVTDGHGQHQVSGEIAQEVFLAAADPKVFPEMGLPPWAPLRVFARVPFARITEQGMFDYATGKYLPPHFHNYVTGVDTTTPPTATVTIHEGDKPNIPAFNGMSYVQWAYQGLALQKTQIGANFRIPPAGAVDVGYTLMASRAHCPTKRGAGTRTTIDMGAPCLASETWASAQPTAHTSDSQHQDLFTGLDTSLQSMADLAPSVVGNHHLVLVGQLAAMDHSISEAQIDFKPDHIETAAPRLRGALVITNGLIGQIEQWEPPIILQNEKFNLLHELHIKRVQLNNALVLALGLDLAGQAEMADIINGSDVNIITTLNSNAGASIQNIHMGLRNQQDRTTPEIPVADASPFSKATEKVLRAGLWFTGFVTRPYFFRRDIESSVYIVRNNALRNAPSTPPALTLWCTFDYKGVALRLESVAQSGGRQVFFVPRLSVAIGPEHRILPNDRSALNVAMEVVPAHTRDVKIHAPIGWEVNTQPIKPFQGTYDFILKPPRDRSTAKLEGAARALDGGSFDEAYRAIGYSGLVRTNFYKTAEVQVIPVDVTTAPNLRIAYLPGTGDEVPAFLPSLGVNPTLLTVKDLTLANLKQFDAIVLGVRVYSAHPELSGAGSKPLLDYARQGGIVINQYNSGGFDPASAPFPFTLPGDSAHNVVEEEQPVTLLAADNPLLNWPNRITAADFNAWIEERGHGFASEWSPTYMPLLETHDAGQDPQQGGLLVAKTGSGAYIYCALALYRQLPEGVPGAYRLMANLLSYARNPAR